MKEIIQELIRTGQWILEKNLTWGTSGNISAREGDDVYITASGTVLGDLKEEDISRVSLSSGKLLEGRKPSKELEMHLAVYRKRPEISAVLHASPFYATFAACSELPLKTDLFIESMYYDADLRRIPYFHAGTPELAQAVSQEADRAHVILMSHHGILVYDSSLAECRSALEVTENVCKMNLMAQNGGIRLQEVDPQQAAEFLQGGYYKKRKNG